MNLYGKINNKWYVLHDGKKSVLREPTFLERFELCYLIVRDYFARIFNG